MREASGEFVADVHPLHACMLFSILLFDCVRPVLDVLVRGLLIGLLLVAVRHDLQPFGQLVFYAHRQGRQPTPVGDVAPQLKRLALEGAPRHKPSPIHHVFGQLTPRQLADDDNGERQRQCNNDCCKVREDGDDADKDNQREHAGSQLLFAGEHVYTESTGAGVLSKASFKTSSALRLRKRAWPSNTMRCSST